MQSQSNNAKTHKHTCPDCKMCQSCSEARCRACREKGHANGARKLSIQEQIDLFNSLNPDLHKRAARCCCKGEDGEECAVP